MKIAAVYLVIGAAPFAACKPGPAPAASGTGTESSPAPLLVAAYVDSTAAGTTSVAAPFAAPSPPPQQATPQRTAVPGYTVTDTTEWGNMLDEGEMAVLRWRGAVIDTVDLGFGVAFVGRDSLLFQPVRVAVDSFYAGDDYGFISEDRTGEFLLWTPSRRRELRGWLPHFDSHWSCAEFFTGALHYWGIVRGQEDLYRLYAMRYDFRSARIDSVYVRDDDLATDYRYHLKTPRPLGKHIAYGSTLIDPRTWQIVRREGDSVVPPESR